MIEYNCETCGKKGKRVYSQKQIPKHFFCSVPCQNEWQKSREDIVIKNKNPEFRKKVSEGLKKRKKLLGDNYHSQEAKAKIGATTVEHWENYDKKTKSKILKTLYANAQKSRTYKPYDVDWEKTVII